MPTMCRSPVHSAANAATCVTCKPQQFESAVDLCADLTKSVHVCVAKPIWIGDLEFEISLGFGAWDLGFPGPCSDCSIASHLPFASVAPGQPRLQNGPGDCLPFA